MKDVMLGKILVALRLPKLILNILLTLLLPANIVLIVLFMGKYQYYRSGIKSVCRRMGKLL